MKGLFNPELVAAIEQLSDSLTDDECKAAIVRGLAKLDRRQLQMVLGFIAGAVGGLEDGEAILAVLREVSSPPRGAPS